MFIWQFVMFHWIVITLIMWYVFDVKPIERAAVAAAIIETCIQTIHYIN